MGGLISFDVTGLNNIFPSIDAANKHLLSAKSILSSITIPSDLPEASTVKSAVSEISKIICK